MGQACFSAVILAGQLIIQEERQFLFLRGQKREEFCKVFAGTRYLLPVIATCDNVIKTAFDLDPWFARHVVGILTGNSDFAKCA